MRHAVVTTVLGCLVLVAASCCLSGAAARQLNQESDEIEFMMAGSPELTADQQAVLAANSDAGDAAGAADLPEPGVQGMDDVYADILDAHNKYRKRHQVSSMGWSDTLADQAANSAARCSLYAESGPNAGENVFVSSGTGDVAPVLTWAADVWYNAVSKYDFGNPRYTSAAGSFTQLVWKSSKNLGCAARVCDQAIEGTNMRQGTVVVCRYSPSGNMAGAFKDNVFPEAPAQTSPNPPSKPPVTEDDPLPGGIVPAGTVIQSPNCWRSTNRVYRMCVQDNANIVLYKNDQVVWASNTTGASAAKPFTLEVLRSGKLVAYDSTNKIYWNSR